MVSGQSLNINQRNWMAISSGDRGTCGARNTSQSVISTTTDLPVDEWFQLTNRFDAGNYRQVLYNGSVEATNSGSRTTDAPNQFRIGIDVTNSNNFNGYITHASVWTYVDNDDWVALRDQLMTVKPGDITAGTLINYWPDCTTDIVGTDHLTRYNTPTESTDEPALFLGGAMNNTLQFHFEAGLQ